MMEQKPQRGLGVWAEASAGNWPRPSCKAEATAELMTARLAELVNVRI